MLVPLIHSRLMDSLEGMPTVCGVLTASLAPDDPRWGRPHPDRSTLREAFAHLADYDVRFRDYLDRALAATATAPRPWLSPRPTRWRRGAATTGATRASG